MPTRRNKDYGSYKHDPKGGEKNDLPSLTEQGKAETLQNIVARFEQGLIVNGESAIYYQGLDGEVDFSDIPEFKKMDNDLTDLERIDKQTKQKIIDLEAKIEQQKAEIEAKARPAPPEVPEPPEIPDEPPTP